MKTMLIAPLCCQHLRVRHRARWHHPLPSGQPPAPPPAAWSPPLWRFYQDWRHPPCSVGKLHFANQIFDINKAATVVSFYLNLCLI